MSKTNKTLIILAVLGLVLIAAAFVIPNFIRARSTPASNACVNVLRHMDGAIQQWAQENQKQLGDKIAMSNIAPYLKGEFKCSAGGTYSIGPAVSNVPTCSFPGHVLTR